MSLSLLDGLATNPGGIGSVPSQEVGRGHRQGQLHGFGEAGRARWCDRVFGALTDVDGAVQVPGIAIAAA